MAIPASVQAFIDHQADQAPDRYDDLRAVIFNGTLKRSPEPSHTGGLLAVGVRRPARSSSGSMPIRVSSTPLGSGPTTGRSARR
jgi:hypothetical protein